MTSKNDLLKELLNNASQKLKEQLRFYRDEDARNMKILQAFKLDDLLSEVPLDLFEKNDIIDYDYTRQIGTGRLNKLSNELFISQLDKNINTFDNINTHLENRVNFLKNSLAKYEEEYYGKLEDATDQDPLDISLLQTSIQKLQVDIHDANNQQESAKDVTSKLKQCFEMKNTIDQYKAEKESCLQEIQKYRLLPPDIYEAEEKLKDLRQKYREACKKFTEVFQNQNGSQQYSI